MVVASKLNICIIIISIVTKLIPLGLIDSMAFPNEAQGGSYPI